MDQKELTQIAIQSLGVAMRMTIAALGVKAAKEMVDAMKDKMVTEQRGPTSEEVDALIQNLEGRSDRIQNAP